MRDIPHQGQGGGQAEGLEDIPDGLGSHSGWGQSGMSTVPMRVKGAQAMLSGQQGEQKWETNQEEREFSNSWTQHHCHIQPPVALQEPATPGLPLRLAGVGGGGCT